MRILYVTANYLPEMGAGPGRVSEMCREWARLGHEAHVLSPVPNHPSGVVPPEFRGKAIFKDVDEFGVHTTRTWIYATPNSGRVRRSAKFASFALASLLAGMTQIPKPSVIIGSSPQLLAAFGAMMVGRLRDVPWIFEVRDLWPESIVAVGAMQANHPVVRGLERIAHRMYESSDAIVVVTDAFRERLIAQGIDPRKLYVIKNGVDLNRFTPRARDAPFRSELGWSDKLIVGYVGTHGMAHGLDAVLDTAKQLSYRQDIRFAFVGDGAERARLQRRIETEHIDNVRLVGVLPRERMPEVYAALDICLVPLRKTELFTTVIPSKIFEIAAMERPIVISVDGEARRLVEASGGGIFVPPEDVAQLAETLARLAADPRLRSELGARGRAYVTKEFDRRALAARYLEVLERVSHAR